MAVGTASFEPEFGHHRPGVAAQVVALAGFLLVCFAAAGLGSLVTIHNIATWYAGLAKPFFTPPSGVFPVAWTLLYFLMAVAGWLVWRQDAIDLDRRAALAAFAVQLILNVAWSWAFFGFHDPKLGLIVIVFLLGAIVWTVLAFRFVSRPAAVLMLPYLAWVCFATALNIGIVVLNP